MLLLSLADPERQASIIGFTDEEIDSRRGSVTCTNPAACVGGRALLIPSAGGC